MKLRILLVLLVIIYASCTNDLEQNVFKDDPNHKKGRVLLGNVDEESKPMAHNLLYLDSSLIFFEKAGDWVIHGKVHNGMTKNYYYGKAFKKGMEQGRVALASIAQHEGTDNANYAFALYNLGLFYKEKNQFEQALKYYRESLAIEEKLPEAKDEDLSITYNGIGNVHRLSGDYDNAEKQMKLANTMLENDAGPRNLNFAPFYFDLGRNYKLQGDDQNAKKYFYKSLNFIFNQLDSVRYIEFLQQIELSNSQQLAEIYWENNQLDSLDIFLEKAMNIQKLNPKFTLFGDYYTSVIMAKNALQQKDYNRALLLFDQAEELLIKELEGGRKSPKLGNLLLEKTKVFLQQGKYKTALDVCQKALKAATTEFDPVDTLANPKKETFYNKYVAIEILSHKADVLLAFYAKQQDLELLKTAHSIYGLISELIPLVRKGFKEEQSKFLLAEETVRIFEKAISNSLKLYKLTSVEKYKEAAFVFNEKNKAVALQEKIQNRQAMTSRNLPEVDVKNIAELETEIAFYEQQISILKSKSKPDTEKILAWEKELNTNKSDRDILVEKLEENYPKYYAMKYALHIPDVKTIQESLEEESALVEYFLGEHTAYVYCITENKYAVFELSDYGLLDGSLKTLMAIKDNPEEKSEDRRKEEFQQFLKTSPAIYQSLLGEAISLIDSTIQNLVIIPDAALFNLPFGVLLQDGIQAKPEKYYSVKNVNYLLENFTISYNYSATTMLQSNAKRRKQESAENLFLGIAPDPDNNLGHSKKGLNRIMTILGKGIPLFGKAANIANVKSKIEDFVIIHFTTHGNKDTANYKENRIALWDGFLKSRDIENLQLVADLVVLSACESGSGKTLKGEGVMSLARSFSIAGSPSLVSSLWRVDDWATSQIMVNFYRHLKSELSKDEALQQALLDFLEGQKYDLLKSHPYYWGAWMLVGNVSPLF